MLAHRRKDAGERDSHFGIDNIATLGIGNGRRLCSDDLLAFYLKLRRPNDSNFPAFRHVSCCGTGGFHDNLETDDRRHEAPSGAAERREMARVQRPLAGRHIADQIAGARDR